MVAAFWRIVGRDLRLAVRGGIGSLIAVVFFVIAATLFPLGVGPELNLLERIAPGVLWVCALLATMLSLGRLFQDDYDDGSLELITLGVMPLELVVLAKTLAHWLTTGVPLIIASPVIAVLLNMSTDGFVVLIISLALGTPILSLIGSVGAALTVGLRRGGVLISLLVLPLYVPILIFGVGAVESAIFGLGGKSHLLILAGGFLGSLALTPWASAVVPTVGRPSGTAAPASDTDDLSIGSQPMPRSMPMPKTPAHTAPLSSASCVPMRSSCFCIGVSGASASPTMVWIWPSSEAFAVAITTPAPLPPVTWVPIYAMFARSPNAVSSGATRPGSLFTGKLSPVSADSSMLSRWPLRMRRSAAT